MDSATGRTSASALAPFSSPMFRAIWLASLSSNFGGLIQAVAAAWLMTSLTTSANLVALVQASTALPIMLFSLASGALADSIDRRRVMLVAQTFMLVVSAGLMICTYTGIVTPWLLLAFTFLIGCGTALNNPSWQASVGDIVPRADLPAAVALNSVGFNLTRSVGPAIGGAIVAAAGAAAAFAVNAVSYVPLILVLARWKPGVPVGSLPRETLGMAMAAGVRYVTMSPNIGKVLVRSFVFGFTAISILALLPLVTRDLLGGGALAYGLLLGSFGVGAIGGAFLSSHLRRIFSGEAIIRLSFLGFAVCAIGAATSRSIWLTGAVLMVGGACWVL
ncbi:MAG TPA: MFS transporter, partial [Methylomirabilota bacterium]|nr:MFS transporter [Methylomirabilota bacterium]